MYTRTIFETAEEYISACRNTREEGDESPVVPPSVYVVFDGEGINLSGEGSEKFELGGKITQETMTEAAFNLLNIKLHVT